MTTFPFRLLVGICLAASPAALCAADAPAKADASAKAPATPAVPPAAAATAAAKAPATAPGTSVLPDRDADVLVLPKIEVTASRIKELDKEIKRLDKAIAREKKNVKATELDKVLNNAKLAEAAAIFGGNSAAYLESVAATRVRYMESERDLLADMKEPRTLEDLTIIKEELERIRTMRRELDKAGH